MTSPPSGPEPGVRCLLVQAGQFRCAIPLASLRRIERALAVHPLPGGRPELLGLAEFGGEPLPVLDLAALVGAPPGATPLCPVTIVAWAGEGAEREAVGLAADAAIEIAALPSPPWLAASGGGAAVRGETVVAGEVVRVVDPAWLGAA